MNERKIERERECINTEDGLLTGCPTVTTPHNLTTLR